LLTELVEKAHDSKMFVGYLLVFLFMSLVLHLILARILFVKLRFKPIEKALFRQEENYRGILELMPDVIFTYDKNGNFIDVNTSCEEKLLFKKEYFLGRNLSEIMPDDIASEGLKAIRYAVRTGKVASFKYIISVDDRVEHFETRMVKISNDRVLAIVGDITDHELEKKEIEYLSYRDSLTGVYNRRYYMEALQEYKANKIRPLGLIIIDVNGLKLVNDTFGHKLGDQWLVKIASIIQGVLTQHVNSALMRIGGDEFVILYPNINKERIEELSSRLVEAVDRTKINDINLSISVGYEVSSETFLDVDQLFISAENHLLRKKVTESQSMRHNVVQAIMSALNEKSERERYHSKNLSHIATIIAEKLELRKDHINDISTAALLHDIGKITIDTSILNKPADLTDEEYSIMKEHVQSSYQILKTIDSYSHLANYVYAHHEHWDGNGYPRKLKKDEIPIVSRIISVADAYDAMRSDRPYQKGISHEKATKELLRCSGTQFDPKIVTVFLGIEENLLCQYTT